MNGEWIQAASGTWHLIWEREGLEADEVGTWCAKVFKFDDPQKPGTQFTGWDEVLHDECLRKSETL